MNYQLIKNNEWKNIELHGEPEKIPLIWNVKKFSDFVKITRGGSPRPIQDFLTQNKEDGTPWIKISDATKVNKYIESTEQYILKSGEKNSRIVYPEDLIVSNSATPGIPRFLKIKACIHDGWLLLRDFNNIDKQFLFFLIGTVREKLKSYGSGSIFTNLSIDVLSNFECIIPPMKEQLDITNILSKQESIIINIEELIEKNKIIFSKLSEQLLLGEIRLKNDNGIISIYKNPTDNWKDVEVNEKMRKIPKDWKVTNFENLGNLYTGKRQKYVPTQNEKDTNKLYFSVGGEHIGENKFKLTNEVYVKESFFIKQKRGQIYVKDLLIIKDGATTGKNMFVFQKPYNNMLLNEHVYRFVSHSNDSYYIYKLFNSEILQESLKTKINGIIPSLNQENFSQIETIYTANLDEQKLISEFLLSKEQLINKLKSLLEKEKEKFEWLLDNLLSGKYLVKEL